MKIDIRTNLKLSSSAIASVQHWAYGTQLFDLDGGFRDVIENIDHKACALHIVTKLPDDTDASPSNLHHVGADGLPPITYFLIEDEAGGLHDYRACTQSIRSRSVMGVVFQDAEQGLWMACKDSAPGLDEIDGEWPIIQISSHTHPTVEASFGSVFNAGPMMGEFQITREEVPRIAWIPWWSAYGSDASSPGQPSEADVLSTLQARAAALRAEGKAVPEQARVNHTKGKIEVGVRLCDWQSEPGGTLKHGAPRSADLKLEMTDTRLEFTAVDGRIIALELQDGDLRVLTYNKESDGPVIVTIPETGEISTDTQAYDAERHFDEGAELQP